MVDTARSQRSPIAATPEAVRPPVSVVAVAPSPPVAAAPSARPSDPPAPPDPPSGTRPSPPGGRRSGPTFELAEVPVSLRPPPSQAVERRCASCDTENERYIRNCRGCGASLDPATQEELRREIAVARRRVPSRLAGEDRASSSPLGSAAVLFRWAPPAAWAIFTVGATLILVLGEVLLKRPGPVFPVALGVIIAFGVCGIVATK